MFEGGRYVPIDPTAADSTEFDVVTLGEAMVRMSPPGHGRLEYAPSLEKRAARFENQS